MDAFLDCFSNIKVSFLQQIYSSSTKNRTANLTNLILKFLLIWWDPIGNQSTIYRIIYIRSLCFLRMCTIWHAQPVKTACLFLKKISVLFLSNTLSWILLSYIHYWLSVKLLISVEINNSIICSVQSNHRIMLLKSTRNKFLWLISWKYLPISVSIGLLKLLRSLDNIEFSNFLLEKFNWSSVFDRT